MHSDESDNDSHEEETDNESKKLLRLSHLVSKGGKEGGRLSATI